MRIARIIFLVLGILLIVFNMLAYASRTAALKAASDDTGYKVGYFIGFNSPLLLGVIFILISVWLGKKIRRKKERNMVDSLLEN